jgi:hypothetical protein
MLFYVYALLIVMNLRETKRKRVLSFAGLVGGRSGEREMPRVNAVVQSAFQARLVDGYCTVRGFSMLQDTDYEHGKVERYGGAKGECNPAGFKGRSSRS